MGLLDILAGGGLGFLTGGWPGAAAGAYGAYQGGQQADAANTAANKAQALSGEQLAQLRWLFENVKGREGQYGDPLLAQLYQWATNPGEGAYERNQVARMIEGVNKAYRPAYATGMAGLSSRGLLSEPNTVAPSQVMGMNRARASAISSMLSDYYGNRKDEVARRLGIFGNALTQRESAASGALGATQAYTPQIGTYAGLATEAGASQYDWLKALAAWDALRKKAAASTPGMPGPYFKGDVTESKYG